MQIYKHLTIYITQWDESLGSFLKLLERITVIGLSLTWMYGKFILNPLKNYNNMNIKGKPGKVKW